MEQVKEKKLSLFNVLFGKNNEDITSDVEDIYDESPYIKKIKDCVEESVSKVEKKTSKNGGFSSGLKKKINQNTLDAMREEYNKAKTEKEKERE